MNYNIGYSSYQALIALMQMPEDELHDDLDEQTIEEWALDIAHENGESWN